MLRIVEEQTPDNSIILRLDGRIVGPWVEVLRESCEQLYPTRDKIILDLLGVSFVDYNGVRLLQQLNQRQFALINCSPFLHEQMKAPATE